MNMETNEDEDEPQAQDTERENDSDSDIDDDDDLHDVPDTREYMPLDVKGLQCLGDDYEDLDEEEEEDEEYLEDVRIREGDALIVVAKTEDVSLGHGINSFSACSLIVSHYNYGTGFCLTRNQHFRH